MDINKKMLVGQIVGLFVLFDLVLFLSAGTIAWLAGWLFLMLFFAFVIATVVWLFRHNPGLLQERMRMSTPDQQGWDKVLFPLINSLFLVWLILMALDATRLHWSDVPGWVQVIGALVLAYSFY